MHTEMYSRSVLGPQAEDILRNHGLYALPVVEQLGDNADKLLGLITRAEISKAFRVRLLVVLGCSLRSLPPSSSPSFPDLSIYG